MDQLFLLPILVFLPAGFLPASTAEELPPPDLSVYPKYPQYYEGENVELICTAKINRSVTGYQFFIRNGTAMPEVAIEGFWSALLTVPLPKGDAETYSCEYWRGKAGEEVRSQRSNAITLHVKDAPKKPSLTLKYTSPQYASMVCSAPPEAEKIVEFQYYGDMKAIQTMSSLNNTDIYNLSITEPQDTGNFKCAYIQLLSGRNVRSEKSDPIFIEQASAGWGRILATGGAFFTINGLLFLTTHYYFLPKVSQRAD